jgi:hypothetical protein
MVEVGLVQTISIAFGSIQVINLIGSIILYSGPSYRSKPRVKPRTPWLCLTQQALMSALGLYISMCHVFRQSLICGAYVMVLIPGLVLSMVALVSYFYSVHLQFAIRHDSKQFGKSALSFSSF